LGGICIVPHPMSWLTLSVGRSRLLRIKAREEHGLYVDGIETFNPSVAGRVAHQRAAALNRAVLGLAETGGSDAHSAGLIGTGYTCFPGHTAADLRRALTERTTRSGGVFWSAADHFDGVATQQWRTMVAHPYRKLVRAINGVKSQ
jgi:predicted metal-dependent phosphoesterase TrpH